MNNIFIKSILFAWAIVISSNIFAVLTDEQKALLDQLPPDQRESVMTKMETANKLEENLEEVFEEQSNLIKRPEYSDLENLEERIPNNVRIAFLVMIFFNMLQLLLLQ